MSGAIEAFPDFFAGEDEKYLFRRQAANAYPFLAPLYRSRPLFRLAIDRKEPLQPAISKAFGLEKSLVKRLANFDARLPTPIGTANDVDLRTRVIAAFSDIDPNHWAKPGDPEEAQAMVDCVRVVSLGLAASTGLDAKTLLAAAKGKWKEFRARLQVAAGLESGADMEDLISAAKSVSDMIFAYGTKVLWPCFWKLAETGSARTRSEKTMQALTLAAADIFFKGKSAAAILELSTKWHGQSADIERRLADADKDAPVVDSNGNIVMKEESYDVVNPGAALQEDGTYMGTKFNFKRAESWDKRRSWPSMTPDGPFVATNGYEVKSIDNCDDIFAIGEKHRLCIASYWLNLSVGTAGYRTGPLVVISHKDEKKVAVCQFSDPTKNSSAGPDGPIYRSIGRDEFDTSENRGVAYAVAFDTALRQFEDHLIANEGAVLTDWCRRMIEHREMLQNWMKNTLKLSPMSRDVGWDVDKPESYDRVMREWGSMRSPQDPNQFVRAPWVTAAYPVGLDAIKEKLPNWIDILETIAPDCDPVLDRRDARLEEAKSLIPSPTA